MCVVSMVTDHFTDRWTSPLYQPRYIRPGLPPLPPQRQITLEEIDEFHKLLERAREYDRRTGQPDCELAEKKAKLQRLAQELGVTIYF